MGNRVYSFGFRCDPMKRYPELDFEKTTHTYTMDGIKVPSVTQILSVLHSYDGVSERVLNDAADRGTIAHLVCDLIESHDITMADIVAKEPEYVGYAEAWNKFLDSAPFPVKSSFPKIEERLCSAKYGFAGTIDRIYIGTNAVTNEVNIVDIKTGVPLPIHDIQLAAYEQIVREEMDIRGHIRRHIVYLDKSGTYRSTECTSKQDIGIFLAALQCHKFKLRGKS